MSETLEQENSAGRVIPAVPEHANKANTELPLFGQICAIFSLKEQDARQYSPLTLAYIGDAVYEMIVRTILVERGNAPVNVLHKHASRLVKAEAQADAYHRIKEQLTEEELSVFRRGRTPSPIPVRRMPPSGITGWRRALRHCSGSGI